MPETKPKVINGISFDILQPYAAGHVLTDIEARVLNQTRAENVGNNVREKIKLALEPEDGSAPKSEDEIRVMVSAFDAEYEFRTASEGAGRSRDPYETEARKIARDLLKEHLASSGRKLTVAPEGVTEDEWKEKVDSEIDRIASSEGVLAAAKKNVDAKKNQSAKLLAGLGEVAV
jgi:hypothetical protein